MIFASRSDCNLWEFQVTTNTSYTTSRLILVQLTTWEVTMCSDSLHTYLLYRRCYFLVHFTTWGSTHLLVSGESQFCCKHRGFTLASFRIMDLKKKWFSCDFFLLWLTILTINDSGRKKSITFMCRIEVWFVISNALQKVRTSKRWLSSVKQHQTDFCFMVNVRSRTAYYKYPFNHQIINEPWCHYDGLCFSCFCSP